MFVVFEIVAPVFGIVALSFALTRRGVFPVSTGDGMTSFMFYVAVPALLFQTLAGAELPQNFPWRYIAAYYGASFLLFGAAMLIAARQFLWTGAEQAIAGITASYSNMVMLGMPLTLATFGERGALPLFILLALQSTLMFPVTIIAIEVYGAPSKDRPHLGWTFARLFLNPVILSLALGLFANIVSLQLPAPAVKTVNLLGAAAPACALIALGAGLAQYRISGDKRTSAVFTAIKCVLHPLLVYFGCWLLDVPTLWTQVAVLLAAMPTGINAFLFAKSYDLKAAVVSKSIVTTTVVSMVIVSLLIHRFVSH